MNSSPLHETLYELFRSLEDAVADRVQALGWPRLGRAQMAALHGLGAQGGQAGEAISVADLARKLDVTRQAAHQTVKQLDAWALILRPQDRDEREGKLITLSDKGHHLLQELEHAIRDTERSLEEQLGVGRMWALRKVLNHLREGTLELGTH